MADISFLLGAGFSRPAGYPLEKQINEKILNLKVNDYVHLSSGDIRYPIMEGQKLPDFDCYKREFFVEIVKHYTQEHQGLRYEEFYDYLYNARKSDQLAGWWDNFRTKNAEWIDINPDELSDYIGRTIRTLNQLIGYWLVDRNGKSRYEPISFEGGGEFGEYTEFLNILTALAQKNTLHLHTLNHDVFIEHFNNSMSLKPQMNDGFHELGSPYYGRMQRNNDLMVRVAQYTGVYEGNLRLYKLHGSIDYVPFYTQNSGYVNHVKSKPAVHITEYFREMSNQDKLKYEHCWINYHTDFLSGVTWKIQRYKEPFYEKLFKLFRDNIRASSLLVIIGYGFADSEVNDIIAKEWSKDKQMIIIDPSPNGVVMDFKEKFSALLDNSGIEKTTLRKIMQEKALWI